MKIIDMHCDTLLAIHERGKSIADSDLHINLKKLRAGGCLAQCFAIFVLTGDSKARYGSDLSPLEFFNSVHALYLGLLEENADAIAPALRVSDVFKNRDEGKMSAILTLEDSVHIDGEIERVEDMFEKGVRMASLTWNYENSLAYPNSADAEEHARGLKPFGFEVVSKMNELGIIVDVSHLSEGGFWDVLRSDTKPFVASHSCARTLCSHQRNLTDEQLKALGDAGGVVGINFYSRFLEDGSDHSTIDGIVRHALHIKNKAGIEALAWGSDFDGIDCRLEFEDYAGFPSILEEMEKHFSASEMDKINSENFLRVFKENCGY